MTSTDDILNQIDGTLRDTSVSIDAMRGGPAGGATDEPDWRTVVGHRLAARHGLAPNTAMAATLDALSGIEGEHTALVESEIAALRADTQTRP